MRAVLVLAMLLLAACTEATLSKIDERTFKIEGPGIPGGSDAPNKRLAAKACPNGYRVLDSASHRGGPDRAIDSYDIMTVWTIRCL
jgi:hypothetical protein